MPPPHTLSWNRPEPGDCGDYYFRYIDLVPDVDILTYLHTQRDWFGEWISGIPDEQARHRYAPGKWSLAEMIGHRDLWEGQTDLAGRNSRRKAP